MARPMTARQRLWSAAPREHTLSDSGRRSVVGFGADLAAACTASQVSFVSALHSSANKMALAVADPEFGSVQTLKNVRA